MGREAQAASYLRLVRDACPPDQPGDAKHRHLIESLTYQIVAVRLACELADGDFNLALDVGDGEQLVTALRRVVAAGAIAQVTANLLEEALIR